MFKEKLAIATKKFLEKKYCKSCGNLLPIGSGKTTRCDLCKSKRKLTGKYSII